MQLDTVNRQLVQRAGALLNRIPDGTWVEVNNVRLKFQAPSQQEVREIRELFPGVFWKKEFNEDCNWWEYHGVCDGVEINIYAVREAPPTCRAVEEEVWIEEKVPVQFETRTVKVKRLKWDCSGADAAIQPGTVHGELTREEIYEKEETPS